MCGCVCVCVFVFICVRECRLCVSIFRCLYLSVGSCVCVWIQWVAGVGECTEAHRVGLCVRAVPPVKQSPVCGTARIPAATEFPEPSFPA